jgi:MFS family permease
VESEQRQPWQRQLKEGVRWLRGHELLWPMAIILGFLNAIGMMTAATFVLFGQEVLGTSARTFALLTTGAAIGGIVGSLGAPRVSQAIGAGPSLALTMVGGAVGAAALALTSSWPVAWLAFGIEAGLGSMWNVITVSLRQAIIPDHLLGRVNSVYRFLAWGMMPIGSLVGGLVVVTAHTFTSREMALRLPYVLAVIGNLILLASAPSPHMARIDAARAAARSGPGRGLISGEVAGLHPSAAQVLLELLEGLPVAAEGEVGLLGPRRRVVHVELRAGGVEGGAQLVGGGRRQLCPRGDADAVEHLLDLGAHTFDHLEVVHDTACRAAGLLHA